MEGSRRSVCMGGERLAKFRNKLLFIFRQSGAEAAKDVRETLDRAINETTVYHLTDFKSRFTIVTDCSGTMP